MQTSFTGGALSPNRKSLGCYHMPLDIGAALVPPLISGVSVGGPPQRLVSRADGGVGTYKCWASRCPSLASDSAVFLATPADGRSSRFSGLRLGICVA